MEWGSQIAQQIGQEDHFVYQAKASACRHTVFGSQQQWYHRAGGDWGSGVPGSGRFGAGTVGSSVPVPGGGEPAVTEV